MCKFIRWYSEEARTPLERVLSHTAGSHCPCTLCDMIRKESSASKIERFLREIVLTLEGANPDLWPGIARHLRELQAAGSMPRHLLHMVGHLAAYVEVGKAAGVHACEGQRHE